MGYTHDTAMSQFIPPNAMHFVTGTYTDEAGQTAGTICKHRAAAATTGVINIPIMLPSNSRYRKGSKLKSVEIEYEITDAVATSITATMNKVTRGIDTAVAVVVDVPVTQDLVAAVGSSHVDTHRLTVTVTTPVWIDNDEYFLLVLTCVCPAVCELDIQGAFANFTFRA